MGVPLRRRRRESGDRRRRCALRSSSESLVRYSHWDTAHHDHSRGGRRLGADASRVTATVTATAATCDNQQRPATAHNARTICANWEYVRPEKRTVVRRRSPPELGLRTTGACPQDAPE